MGYFFLLLKEFKKTNKNRMILPKLFIFETVVNSLIFLASNYFILESYIKKEVNVDK